MKELRQKAVFKLKQSVEIDGDYCLVEETKLKKTERDLLLKELEQGQKYLSVPMALFFSSPFWRRLKAQSNELVEEQER